MSFKSETEFENHIRNLISQHITKFCKNIYSLENKNINDIIVCRDCENPALFFIEAKLHKISHKRINIGSPQGGFQPEVIFKKPLYLERNLRWALAIENQSGFLLLTTDRIRNYLSGGSIRQNMQNNLKPAIFKEETLLTEVDFIISLRNWLCASET